MVDRADIENPHRIFTRSRRWLWAMFFAAGGMPSSHTALMVSGTLAVALYHGFDSPIFGIAVAATMIIAHDAAGVRRQAGIHAERINVLFEELLKGHMWDENELKEVIGHTPAGSDRWNYFGAHRRHSPMDGLAVIQG